MFSIFLSRSKGVVGRRCNAAATAKVSGLRHTIALSTSTWLSWQNSQRSFKYVAGELDCDG